jgi:hypothetical protein
MKNITIVSILLMLFSVNTQAGGNPGEDAMRCINASANGDRIKFKNNCGYKVFVVWCGKLKYSKKRCGDGPRNSYYTNSNNIDAYGSTSASISGNYSYAACKGGISFGNKGIDADADDDGSYICKRTGSYNR